MQWQPDALQPDNQHKLQAATPQGREKACGIPSSKHTNLEEIEPKHGVVYMQFDPDEGCQQHDAQKNGSDDQGITPAHWRPPVWLNTIGDPQQEDGEAKREGHVSQPVNLLMFTDGRCFAQHHVGPNGADDPNRHADEEDETPVNRSQDAADNQANERPGDPCNLINA